MQYKYVCKYNKYTIFANDFFFINWVMLQKWA